MLDINVMSNANLAALSREAITISFDPIYHSATAGSSAWSIVASNIYIQVAIAPHTHTPQMIMARLLGRLASNYIYVQQTIWLLPMPDGMYVAKVPLPLYIRGGSNGQTRTHKQFVLFDRLFYDINENFPNPVPVDPLIDPMNGTGRFQMELFQATPYARVEMGEWSSLSI